MDSCSAERQSSSICPSDEAMDASHRCWKYRTGHSQRNPEQYPQTSRLEMRHLRYDVIIEKSDTGYEAFVHDLPGCVAVGESIQETERLITLVIEIHLDRMNEDGVDIHWPTSVGEYVEV